MVSDGVWETARTVSSLVARIESLEAGTGSGRDEVVMDGVVCLIVLVALAMGGALGGLFHLVHQIAVDLDDVVSTGRGGCY